MRLEHSAFDIEYHSSTNSESQLQSLAWPYMSPEEGGAVAKKSSLLSMITT